MFPRFKFVLLVCIGLVVVNGNNVQARLSEEQKVSSRQDSKYTNKWFFWSYPKYKKSPIQDGDLMLKAQRRAELKLESGDLRNYLGYGFIMPKVVERLSISCVDFNLPCSEGSLNVVSNGHFKSFCGDSVPFNHISISRYMYIKFLGKGGPYTSNLRCFISGIKAESSTNGIFTPLADTVDCDEALPDPSTYSTVEGGCQCGTEDADSISRFLSSRVQGGSVPDAHSHPFMAVVHSKTYPVGSEFHCSGVLVSDQWVLTTASCARHIPVETLAVSFGNHDILDNSGTSYTIVESVSVGYNVLSREGDLYMLKLSSAIDLTASWKIKPICLPNVCVPTEGLTAHVAGWGGTTTGETYSNTLNSAQVTVLTNDDCNTSYNGAITSKMICASAAACNKDLGAPLWRMNSKGRAELIGIHSWADGCDGSSKPGVFTRISEYAAQIISTIQDTTDSITCSI